LVLAQKAILNPLSAKYRAISFPIPLDAPVITLFLVIMIFNDFIALLD
jgi:hypothetical protein